MSPLNPIGFYGDLNIPVEVSATNVNVEVQDFGTSGRVPASGYANTTTTVSYGVGPFTYAWTKQTSADGTAFTQLSSITQHNGWYGNPRHQNDFDNTETWKVVVTDTGDGDNTAEDTISVTLTWTNLS